MVRFVNEQHLPMEEPLKMWLDPKYVGLETMQLRRRSEEWSPFVCMDSEQDEYAIATMMYDMQEYIAFGREVYPMAEALEDAYWMLLATEALKIPGSRIIPEKMPWH